MRILPVRQEERMPLHQVAHQPQSRGRSGSGYLPRPTCPSRLIAVLVVIIIAHALVSIRVHCSALSQGGGRGRQRMSGAVPR